jgi:hypothetical protein
MYSVLMRNGDSEYRRFPNMTSLEACLLKVPPEARFMIVSKHSLRRRILTKGELVIHLLMTEINELDP